MWTNEPITAQPDGTVLVPNGLSEVGDCVPAHRHVGDHLTICQSGLAEVTIVRDGVSTITTLRPGEALWIPGGCVHGVTALAPDTMVHCLWSQAQFAIEQAKGGCLDPGS